MALCLVTIHIWNNINIHVFQPKGVFSIDCIRTEKKTLHDTIVRFPEEQFRSSYVGALIVAILAEAD